MKVNYGIRCHTLTGITTLLFVLFINNALQANGFSWVQSYSIGTRGVEVYDVSSDYKGGFYICGKGYASSWTSSYLQRYDSAGTVTYSPGLSPSYSGVISVGSDTAGNFYFITYVYGLFNTATFGGVTFINPSGNTVWQYLIKSDPNGNYISHKVLLDGTNDLSQRICVEPNGKYYISTATSCRAFDSSGVQVWINNTAGGTMIRASQQFLYVSGTSTVKRLHKTTGALNGQFSVNGLTSCVATGTDDFYYSDSLGTYKRTSLANVWASTVVKSAHIGVDNANVWATTSGFDGTNNRDSVFFWRANLSSGSFAISDTLIHVSHLFAGPSTVFCGVNGSPTLILDVVGTSYQPYSIPPFLLNASYYYYSDIILAKYNPQVQPTLGFADYFWDLYGDLYWRGDRKCPGGSAFNIDYKLYNYSLLPGTIIVAEMSSANGSFATPYLLGAVSPSGNTGSIVCTIPSTVPDGSGYLVRLRSTSPALISVQNSLPLGIQTPASTVSLTGSSTFCSLSKPIECSYAGGSYVWQRNGVNVSNSNTAQFRPSQSGTYRCLVTAGCSRLSSNSVTVTTLPLPSAAITPPVKTTICNGDSVTLALSSPGSNSFQWFRANTPLAGATSGSYSVKSSGTYKVTVTNTNGCTKTSAGQKITVLKPIITPLGPTTFCAGGSVILSVDTTNVTSIQWYKGNLAVSGQTAQFFIANQAANYKVLCTYTNTCSAMSNSIKVTVNCRSSDEDGLLSSDWSHDDRQVRHVDHHAELHVYPNPAQDHRFNVEFLSHEQDGVATLEIYNSMGKLLNTEQVLITDGYLQRVITVSPETKGQLCLLRLISNGEVFNERVILK